MDKMLKVPVILKFNTARENSRGLGNQTLSPGVGSVISTYLVIVLISVRGQRRKHKHLSNFDAAETSIM